ncbi:MAG: hypothetical protein H0W88_12290 [Parachlamydiaceae bacterium]|nr:hypothetical protein [Parachlamydiaceae bacterium]
MNNQCGAIGSSQNPYRTDGAILGTSQTVYRTDGSSTSATATSDKERLKKIADAHQSAFAAQSAQSGQFGAGGSQGSAFRELPDRREKLAVHSKPSDGKPPVYVPPSQGMSSIASTFSQSVGNQAYVPPTVVYQTAQMPKAPAYRPQQYGVASQGAPLAGVYSTDRTSQIPAYVPAAYAVPTVAPWSAAGQTSRSPEARDLSAAGSGSSSQTKTGQVLFELADKR